MHLYSIAPCLCLWIGMELIGYRDTYAMQIHVFPINYVFDFICVFFFVWSGLLLFFFIYESFNFIKISPLKELAKLSTLSEKVLNCVML